MDHVAEQWYGRRTTRADDWPLPDLLAAKRQAGASVSVVVPARNEAESIGSVVGPIVRELVEGAGLVDELVVMDSLSSDETAAAARAGGATVHSVADVRSDLGVQAGKGEAMWKSLFVTTGSLLVFIDADLTEWGTHFVTGLLGPLLADPDVLLARGFYDRVMDEVGQPRSTEGGRVTELVARPVLASRWPELSAVVQPLAGEWAIRRAWFEQLHVPVGYGVEFATLVDTYAGAGLDAVAQVDLGSRAHRHQHVHDLGAMALEILHVADSRSGYVGDRASAMLAQFDRDRPQRWVTRTVTTAERPPAVSVAGYPLRQAAS